MSSVDSPPPLGSIDWSRLYATWGVTTGSVEYAYSPARVLDVLARFLPRGQAAKVLELGCAPGRWLGWVQDCLGATPYGVELDGVGIRLTNQLYRSVRLVQADAQVLPFPDDVFDAVFSIGLIEHFDEPRPLLREMRRVLRAGGICVVVIPNISPGTLHGWHWRVFQPDFYACHRPYTLDQLSRTILSAGLEVVHSECNGLYLPHMQRILGRLPIGRLVRLFENRRTAANLAIVAIRAAGTSPP